MKRTLAGFAAVLMGVSIAHAGPDHDPKLERAAAEIVAAKMGDLRQGFEFGKAPELVRGRDDAAAEAVGAGALPEGLAVATQRAYTIPDAQ